MEPTAVPRTTARMRRSRIAPRTYETTVNGACGSNRKPPTEKLCEITSSLTMPFFTADICAFKNRRIGELDLTSISSGGCFFVVVVAATIARERFAANAAANVAPITFKMPPSITPKNKPLAMNSGIVGINGTIPANAIIKTFADMAMGTPNFAIAASIDVTAVLMIPLVVVLFAVTFFVTLEESSKFLPARTIPNAATMNAIVTRNCALVTSCNAFPIHCRTLIFFVLSLPKFAFQCLRTALKYCRFRNFLFEDIHDHCETYSKDA
mmetsp:Transcript_5785/g.16976  ORF Transcript_5785/g.16976 Transcript_5785/m.16976 type:complete len:267 (+) Transcript_5785:353-1153(+)